MEIAFEKEYLKKLYYEGKTGDKQHRFQPEIVKKAVLSNCLTIIRNKQRWGT
jgi:hypothetical protein